MSQPADAPRALTTRRSTLELTVTPGAGNAEMSGYWTIESGSNDVYGIVEKTRQYHDAEMYTDGIRWSLHVRTGRERDRNDTFMAEMHSGEATTLDEAVQCLREVWPTELNDA